MAVIEEFKKWLEEYDEDFNAVQEGFEIFFDETCVCGGTHRVRKKSDGAIEVWDVWHERDRPCLVMPAGDRETKIMARVLKGWYLSREAILEAILEASLAANGR